MNSAPRQTLHDLRSSVEKECAAMEDVIAILRREQEQLVSGSSEGLDSVVNEKNSSLDLLERKRQDRLNTMKNVGAPIDPGMIDQFVGADTTLSRLWQRLRALARECQRINALNGRLVNVRLQFVDGRLDSLRRVRGNQSVYDTDGRSGYPQSSRIIAAA
ncbi:MAG: flagella synthesis protein FlgN [Burkholderiales bacterium]